jgi:hypothetical protein
MPFSVIPDLIGNPCHPTSKNQWKSADSSYVLLLTLLHKGEKMEFDKSKGFCNGLYIRDGRCEFTFHDVKHTQSEIAKKNCKDCSSPLARSHRKQFSEAKREAAK